MNNIEYNPVTISCQDYQNYNINEINKTLSLDKITAKLTIIVSYLIEFNLHLISISDPTRMVSCQSTQSQILALRRLIEGVKAGHLLAVVLFLDLGLLTALIVVKL